MDWDCGLVGQVDVNRRVVSSCVGEVSAFVPCRCLWCVAWDRRVLLVDFVQKFGDLRVSGVVCDVSLMAIYPYWGVVIRSGSSLLSTSRRLMRCF